MRGCPRTAATAIILYGIVVAAGFPQDAQQGARDLITSAVANQLKNDTANSHFQYLEKRGTDKDSRTYEVMDSDSGAVELMVRQNDQPLTSAQSQHEAAWLAQVLANPEIMRKRQSEDAREAARRKQVISALPGALLYSVEDENNGVPGIRVHFTPNPAYRPTSHETQICRAVEGDFWLDASTHMILKAEGELIRGVNFGWGFLAHLDQGGRFSLEQAEVVPGVWRITAIDVEFTGHELFFKPLNIKVHERASGFHQLPEHFSVADAVNLLRTSSVPDSVH